MFLFKFIFSPDQLELQKLVIYIFRASQSILRDTILDNPTILKVRECNAFYSLKKSIITLHLSSYRFTLGENKKGGSMRHKY